MRAGVWWSAAALALLTVACALRAPQAEGATRVGRRLPALSAPDNSDKTEDVQPTFRPRNSRRREETPPREATRTRTKSRAVEKTDAVAPEIQRRQPQEGRSGQSDSRRTSSRTRSRPVENEPNKEKSEYKEQVIRSRIRQISKRPTQTTRAPLEVSSPTIDESKVEVINSNLDETTKVTLADQPVSSTQFRRRSSTAPTTESVAPIRSRGRINTRINLKPLDLAVAGTTNSIYFTSKEPTTARTSGDLRNSRKLRYRSRLSETDTNLPGEGIVAKNEVTKSSQNIENITSQPEIQTDTPVSMETTFQPSVEVSPVKSMNIKPVKVVRRPLARGSKVNFRPSVSLPKLNKPSEEISEDDNYPESFKALIQSKNASTQTSSPTSESLSVKASQKIFKTYSSSAQSTNTGPAKNKYNSRFRSRINTEEEKKKEIKDVDKTIDTTLVQEKLKARTPEYRPRGTYTPRNRKSFTPSLSSASSTERPVYKFNRKLKITTTGSTSTDNTIQSKKIETSDLQKKTQVRSSYFSRRNLIKNATKSTEAPIVTDNGNNEDNDLNSAKTKTTLPKTSYYSRLRNKIKSDSIITTTTEIITEANSEQALAQNKNENSNDVPLIFSLLKNSLNTENTNAAVSQENKENEKEMFIISVTSKEFQEKGTENEVVNNVEESENKPIINNYPTTVKYHANYKDMTSVNGSDDKDKVTVATPIRNIQTRTYGRKRTKSKDSNEDMSEVTSKPRDRNQRKYSESFSKTTEPNTNGITPEPEKNKSRFSSKYRSSYLEKPFYKPTVPTITSSTAWLKFFVTDYQLAKYVEEPKWFEGEDIYDVTTEMTRESFTSPSIIHESSLELVEGEETILGPDMNAISFTRTRSTLSSADLRLSESLVKPSHIMNVEASQHSPSVTVSIFDALAEILTSTPRTPRLSTTTEVIQNNNNDVKQTLGVSNNINVNTVSVTTKNAVINTKSVQITDQTTPTVINRVSAGGTATPSLNTEEGNLPPVNTPTAPTPTPTTPISARKPFAIKFLYSDTEPPIDKLSTATEPSSNPTTDNLSTVHNSVSNTLLPNNNLVSSGLTSMLSNNIRNILQNMDENSRSKLSVDMARLLKTLIPRALNGLKTGLDNIETVPDTTPYSLEDIKDTEIINVDEIKADPAITSISFLQNVATGNNVNTESNIVTFTTENPTQAVNSPSTMGTTNSILSASTRQTTLSDTIFSTASLTTVQSSSAATMQTTLSSNSDTSSVSLGTDSVSVDGEINTGVVNNSIDSFNTDVPLPFFTNAKVKDFIANDSNILDDNLSTTQILPQPLSTQSVTVSKGIDIIYPENPSLVSSQQLWVLSKKARVLKMIEEIIRLHNEEIAIAPLTDLMLNQENNIPLSNRLTEIINAMTTTTQSTDSLNIDGSTSPMTTPSSSPIPLSTSTQSAQTNPAISGNTEITNEPTSQIAPEVLFRFQSTGTITAATQSSTETIDAVSTTPVTTQVIDDILNRAQEVTTTSSGDDQTITQGNTETTTTSVDMETTQVSVDITTLTDIEITTQADVKNTTNASLNETKQNLSILRDQINFKNQIPKKDYVIFGILPNNTVVRKDPNDDILETLTEASPYIVYSVLPNNTVIRRFPNGTRVPRVMQKIDILPISPWSLRNPYSPIHNNPAIVRPQSNPIRVSSNIVTSKDISNNGTENRLTNDTVNNQQTMIPSSALNIKSSSFDVTTATIKSPAEKSTASHVLSLRTSTMLPSVEEILLNSISSAAKEEMVIASMTSSTREPRILTLDIDPETQQIRTEKPDNENGGAVFKFIPIDDVTVSPQDTNVQKLASTKSTTTLNTGGSDTQTVPATTVTEINTQPPQIQTRIGSTDAPTTTVQIIVGTSGETNAETVFTNIPTTTTESTTSPPTATVPPTSTVIVTTIPPTTTTTELRTTTPTPTTTTPAPTTTTPTSTTTTPTSTTTTPTSTTTTPTSTTTTPAPTTTTPTPMTTMPAPTTTTPAPATTTSAPTPAPTTTTPTATITLIPTTTAQMTTFPLTVTPDTTVTLLQTATSVEEDRKYQEDVQFLQSLLQGTERSPKSLSVFTNANQIPVSISTTSAPTTQVRPSPTQQSQEAKLLQALLSNGQTSSTVSIPNIGGNIQITSRTQTTTSRSIEDDIRQFQEDTKLLKALLAATGQNPASLNIPSLDSLNIPTRPTAPTTITTTPGSTTIRTTPIPTTTHRIQSTTPTINDDIKKFQEDAQLLQALLQSTGQNTNNLNFPIISGITSNVRIASNPLTTSIASNPTTPVNLRPVYTSRTTTPSSPVFTTLPARTVPILTTLQPRAPTSTVADDAGISTTFRPIERRRLPTTDRNVQAVTARRAPTSRFTVTTEVPSTSTFSDVEDLLFLQNLKSVLNTNPGNDDPEAALANRVIALAVERSLNEIKSGIQADDGRTGKSIATTAMNRVPSTTTTTTTTSTTTPRAITTTVRDSTPSLEDDLRQFQEDTKLLQALLQATGQDPSKFNIPTLPITNNNLKVSSNLPARANDDLKLLSNLLASPSPLNEPFDSLTQKPIAKLNIGQTTVPTTVSPYGARIAVNDNLKSAQDDAKLLQTLVKLQGVQETTTQRNKLTITGQSTDEALQKLIQQTKPTGMVSEATKAPISISTEYGKSQDALLAALLKEQGFGPTTASSLDEQLRLAALLNQVVVTPKTRRTTTPPPPPPAPRRPILDGLAWLWQQWRETGPGPAGAPRPQNRRPPASPSPVISSSAATSNRVNWFGSGPFVGNADERPTSNRIPLEPPRAVAAEQTPGRGQLVSAAINVTRAFSQFLGAAIQGAAQTVQNVIRAGQRAAGDAYSNGSG